MYVYKIQKIQMGVTVVIYAKCLDALMMRDLTDLTFILKK